MSAIRQIAWLFLVLALSGQAAGQGFAPEHAAKRMTVPKGFRVELVASEPQIRQPVAIDFDERGRLWVLQYLQYPNPAGLKRVKVDRTYGEPCSVRSRACRASEEPGGLRRSARPASLIASAPPLTANP